MKGPHCMKRRHPIGHNLLVRAILGAGYFMGIAPSHPPTVNVSEIGGHIGGPA